jgi:hypothetical protein
VCSVLYCHPGPQEEQRITNFSVVPTHESECNSQHLEPLLRGRTEWFGGGVGLSQN